MQIAPAADILNGDTKFLTDRRKQVLQVYLLDGDLDVKVLPLPEAYRSVVRGGIEQIANVPFDFGFGVPVEGFDPVSAPPVVLGADVKRKRPSLRQVLISRWAASNSPLVMMCSFSRT
jgi:hypothetical protein